MSDLDRLKQLLRDAAEELHASASFYAEHGIGDGYRDCSKLAREIEEALGE